MKLKAIIPLLLAAVMGVVALKMGRRILDQRLAANQPQAGVKVVVVRGDLPAGHQLGGDDLMLVSMPPEFVPAATFKKVDDASGRVLAAPTTKGQMMVETLLAPKGAVAGLQAMVPKGMRAVTVEVNEVSGVAGLLSPGCNVDVVATLQDEKTRETVGRTIVQNVSVSAVGQKLSTKEDKAGGDTPVVGALTKSVTLIVTPQQAEAIDLAATKSRLRLVLRSAGDDSPMETAGVTLAQLTKGREEVNAAARETMAAMLAAFQARMKPADPPPPPAPVAEVVQEAAEPPPAPKWAVQVIRGSAESVVYFDPEGKTSPAAVADAKVDPFSAAIK